MSDVSVKFGAEDIGLEKTLKSVQAELGNLQDKVKSGDLSMTDLERSMKRVGQLESLEKRLQGMGNEAGQTSPRMDALGKDMKQMGDNAADAGDKGGISFGKLAAASAAGGLAVAGFTKVMSLAMDGARAVAEKFGDALDLGGRLNDLSSRTGETAGNVLVLERAFTNAGSSAENVGPAINKLQKFMEAARDSSSAQGKAMDQLGISMDDLEGKTPTQQMQVFAEKISQIQDPTTRAATAMTVFGKSGGELLPILSNFSGELETAKGQLGSLPGVMDRSAASFDTISDNLTVMKGKVLDFAAGFLEKAAPALEKFTNLLSGVDAAGWGEKTMSMILKIADTFLGVFQSPMKYIELIGQALDLHARTFGNLLVNGVTTMGDLISKIFGSSIPSIISDILLNSLIKVSVDATKSFLDLSLKTIDAFVNTFGSGIDGLMKFFSKSLGMVFDAASSDLVRMLTNPIGFFTDKMSGALISLANDSENSFKNSFDSSSGDFISKLSSGLGGVSDEYANKLKAGTSSLKGEFSDVFKSIKVADGDIFDAKGSGAKLRVIAGELEASGRAFRENLTQGSSAMDEATKSVSTAGEEFLKFQNAINPLEAGFGAVEASADDAGDSVSELNRTIDILPSKKEVKVEAKIDNAQQFEKDVSDLLNILTGVPNAKVVNMAIDAGGFDDLDDLRKQVEFFPDSKQVKMVLEQLGIDLDELKTAINGLPEEKRSKIAMDVLGNPDLERAVNLLGAINGKKVTAACEVFGVDSVDKLSNAIRGIPEPKLIQAVMEVTGEEDLTTAMFRLDTLSTKERNALLKMTGLKDINDVKDALNGIKDEEKIKKAVEVSGVSDVQELKDLIDIIQNQTLKPATFTLETEAANISLAKIESAMGNLSGEGKLGLDTDNANTELGRIESFMNELEGEGKLKLNTEDSSTELSNIESAMGNLSGEGKLGINTDDADTELSNIESAMGDLSGEGKLGLNTDDADTELSNIKSKIDALGKDVTITLNADASIQKIRNQLSQSLDVNFNNGGSGKGSMDINLTTDDSNLETLVDLIKGYVDEIRGKLPLHALSY